jgi:4-hydroxymandelate oxidase
MGKIESTWSDGLARRAAFRSLAALLAGSPLLQGQQDPFRDHSRVPKLDELTTPFDFESVAYAKVPRAAFDYTAYGTDGEFTLRRNRQAFDWVNLVPGGFGGGIIDTSTEVLGTRMAFPIMLSPSAGHAQLHPDAEIASHQGATAASNTPMIVSNNASTPIDKIAAAAKGPLWFQLYPREDIEANREILESAQAAGCKAIVVTIDQQASVYEREQHNRNLSPPLTSTSRRAASSRQTV